MSTPASISPQDSEVDISETSSITTQSDASSVSLIDTAPGIAFLGYLVESFARIASTLGIGSTSPQNVLASTSPLKSSDCEILVSSESSPSIIFTDYVTLLEPAAHKPMFSTFSFDFGPIGNRTRPKRSDIIPTLPQSTLRIEEIAPDSCAHISPHHPRHGRAVKYPSLESPITTLNPDLSPLNLKSAPFTPQRPPAFNLPTPHLRVPTLYQAQKPLPWYQVHQNRQLGIDMNSGWTRLYEKARDHFLVDEVRYMRKKEVKKQEEKTRLWESHARFSFKRQEGPRVFADKWVYEWKRFEVVFAGNGGLMCDWNRTPGSWWNARKSVFGLARGMSFWDGVEEGTRCIEREVERKRYNCAFGQVMKRHMHVRKRKVEELEVGRGMREVGRRVKRNFKHRERFPSDEWRRRRREQEKKAGRWTDGTVRMDRMWELFHWVCDDEGVMTVVAEYWN